MSTNDLEIANLKVCSLDIQLREISWETSNAYADPRDFTMQVWRSEAPDGPFEPVSPLFEDRYTFVDANIPVGDKYRQLWYRLRVTHKSTGAVPVDTKSVTLEAEPDIHAQYIRRVQQTGLTQAFGRAVWLFKRRTFGLRCPSCFNVALQQKTRANCKTCFDVGFLRGYMDPVEVWMQIDPGTKSTSIRDQQKEQTVTVAARMSFHPPISPGDVVVEAENKRWRVCPNVTQSERLRAVVQQQFNLMQIQETDIEYSLPLNLDRAIRDIQPSPGRMFTMPADLNAAITERTPNIFAYYGEKYPAVPED